ncbi:GntR family transcriptional regulator [Halalkalibacter alkaliphilus]|uniref:GntR family transcriptional regulator n=1 Tax=Halalkalibacter alkaliphilus TaxID=2917993 RepID=A0A9X2I939_9BACI|nr:GntR family transcriptional regulator [Halalkalibacter alkaliphilus]MCL7749229.1 GntR family transcriptional regulator [Halalkalibacter alkaliphilus]
MEKDIKTDSVFDHIYKGIKDGLIKSGETLSERGLASELNVSRTPVREALRRLENYGLVEPEPHKGVKVISFSEEKVKQLYQVREVLEGLGAKLLAEKANPKDIERLEMLLAEAEKAAKNNDIDLLRNINSQFHIEIASSTNNLYLINTMQTLQSHISVCMGTSLKVTGRPLENIEEHHLILDAIKRGEPDFAEAVTKYHVRKSMENVLKNLEI